MLIQRLPEPALRSAHGPVDGFTPSSVVNKAKQDAGLELTRFLDIRVPTTTPSYSPEKAQKVLSIIQPGDIVLETNNAYPNWQRMEELSMRSAFTHAFMYEGAGKFIEATTGGPVGVRRTDLKEYLEGPIQLCIVRPRWKSPKDVNQALDYCRSQLGKPYDTDFRLDDNGDKQYCAELVYRALQACDNHYPVPLVKVFGKDEVPPDAFKRMAGADVVYDDGATFWKNMGSHWPVAAGAAATALAGAAAYGPVGALVGFTGGLLLSIGVGNKIQTGYFNLAGDAHK